MGMEFGFAKVPFAQDGDLGDIFKPTTEPWLEPKDDVLLLDTKDDVLTLGRNPSICLDFQWNSVEKLNCMTGGVFYDLCGGDQNGRYVLLEPHRQHLAMLQEMLPNLPGKNLWQQQLKEQLQLLLNSAKTCLEQHGARAAMLIY